EGLLTGSLMGRLLVRAENASCLHFFLRARRLHARRPSQGAGLSTEIQEADSTKQPAGVSAPRFALGLMRNQHASPSQVQRLVRLIAFKPGKFVSLPKSIFSFRLEVPNSVH